MKDNPFKAMTVFEMNLPVSEFIAHMQDDPPELVDPSGSEWRRIGFVPVGDGEFFHDLDGAGVAACVQFNERILPGKVIREHVAKMAANIEERDGRKPGRKEIAELREEAEQDLLPRAFIRRSRIHLIFRKQRLFVFTSSAKKCDDVLKVLLDASPNHPMPGLVLQRIGHDLDMVTYLTGNAINIYGEFIASHDSAVLRREGTETIRVKDRDVASREVQVALKNGYRVHELGMTLGGNINFKLTDQFVFKGLTFSEELETEYTDERQQALDFHATAWMVCREYDDLVTTVLNEVKDAATKESEDEEL